MRRTLLCLLAGLVLAAPASAASTFTIRGAGFGHGVGMSQYGAAGMAKQGWSHERILAHYFSGTQLGTAPADTVIRVLMQSPRTATFTGATNAGTEKLDPARRYQVRAAAGGRVELLGAAGKPVAAFDAPLRVTNAADDPITLVGTAGNGVRDGAYRGWFEFRPGALGEVLAINALGLEQYVAGVIANEAIPSWPADALEAQAVAARTYAIATGRGAKNGWDQYPDTRSQMYRGAGSEQPSTNKAVNGTAGQIVTYAGKPATTFFFSTSGGRTESVENGFPGAQPQPYLVSVDDPYDDLSPYHRWGPIKMSRAAAGGRLGRLVKGSFKGIKVLRRGGSPRIVRAAVVGSGGRTEVTGADLRRVFGLRDTWMTFNSATADVETPAQQPDPVTPATPAPAPSGSGTGGATAAGHARSRVVGSAYPARPGTAVALQRRAGGRWVPAGATRLGATRRYKVSLPGPGIYRVVIGGLPGPTVRAR